MSINKANVYETFISSETLDCNFKNYFFQTYSNLPIVLNNQDIYWLYCRDLLKILNKNSL